MADHERTAPRARGLLPAALLAWHHVGYPLALAVWERRARSAVHPSPATTASTELPAVALVIAAHNEEAVIAGKVENALELDYPRSLLQIVVACDGCTDGTVAAARKAGADLVLDLERGGKMQAQHVAIGRTEAPVVAFSDANSRWDPRALLQLVGALSADGTGYACGRVTFVRDDGGDNQEGAYWRYEMALRARESALASVTAGNGAIYAIRRDAYDDYNHNPVMGHDLAMPFQLVRAGWRAVDVPGATATEKMVPTIEGEARRKRRMMSHAWPIVLRGGMLDLRGQPPRYALMLVSHRWLRYFAPALHLWLAVRSLYAAPRSAVARVLVVQQLAVIAGAAAAGSAPDGPVRKFARLCRYYLATQTAIALGLRDHLVDGTEAAWTPPEGTR